MEPRSRCNNAIHVLNYFKKLGVEICNKLNLSFGEILHGAPRDWKEYRSYRKWIIRAKSILGK